MSLRSRLSRPATVTAALLALTALAGCGGNASGGTPSWQAQPDFQGNNEPNPQLPNPGIATPSLPNTGPQPTPSAPGGGGSSAAPASDPNVVATKLAEPTGLVVLPDGTALVGERKTGRILRVQPTPGQPATLVQRLAGVDGSGDGGLLDLAISPNYAQDGLIYAYLTTATDNRVVHFALGSAPSVVLGNIPKGRTGNGGRIAFDATGALLIGTGATGRPLLANATDSLAGKVLRTDDIGRPARDNPNPASPIYSEGYDGPDGVTALCVDPKSGMRVAISRDRAGIVQANGSFVGQQDSGTTALPAKTPGAGGCAIAGGQLLVATSTGQALVPAPLGATSGIGSFTAPGLQGRYGRLRTVVAGPDGALWLTTRNRDGHGKPIAEDDRVIRITDTDSSSPVV